MAGFWVCWFFCMIKSVLEAHYWIFSSHIAVFSFRISGCFLLMIYISLLNFSCRLFIAFLILFNCISVSSCISLSYYVVFKFFIRQIVGLHFFGVNYCGSFYFSLVVFYLPDSSWSMKLPVGVCTFEGENTSYSFYRLLWQESSSVGFQG